MAEEVDPFISSVYFLCFKLFLIFFLILCINNYSWLAVFIVILSTVYASLICFVAMKLNIVLLCGMDLSKEPLLKLLHVAFIFCSIYSMLILIIVIRVLIYELLE